MNKTEAIKKMCKLVKKIPMTVGEQARLVKELEDIINQIGEVSNETRER